MKNRILVAFMLALALTLAAFAAPVVQNLEGADEYAEALDTGVQTAENRTNLVPILREGYPVLEKQTARLSSDISDKHKIIVKNISSTGLFEREKTVYADVAFDVSKNSLLDAKKKLILSIVDGQNKVVAKQKSCETAFNIDSWDLCLRYELEFVSDHTLSQGNQYFFKFDYTGEYTFELQCDYPSLGVSTRTEIIKMKTVNASQNIVDFYIANANDSDTYIFNIQDVDYSATRMEKGVYRVQMTELDYSRGNDYSGELWLNVIVRNLMGHVCSGEFLFYFVGNDEHMGAFGIYGDDLIHADSKYTYMGIECKENGEYYKASDASKIQVTVFDAYTGEIVGQSKQSGVFITNGYCDVEVDVEGKIQADRDYIITVDDGYTIRIWFISSVGGTGFSHALIKMQDYDEYSYDLYEADSYEAWIPEAYGMSDSSKFDATILDYESNVFAKLDKSSIRHEKISGKVTSYYFTLDVVGTLEQHKYYQLNIMYDGEYVGCQDLYYFPEESDEDVGGIYYASVDNAFNDGENTYALIAMHVYQDDFVITDTSFKMVSTNASSVLAPDHYDGTIHNVFKTDDMFYMVVVKFPMAETVTNNYRISIKNGESTCDTYAFYSGYQSLPYVYNYAYMEEDGTCVVYGEDLPEGTYELMMFKAEDNSSVTFPMTKIAGKDELTVKVENSENYRFINQAYIVIDGKEFCSVDSYIFVYDYYFSGSDFFARCRNQNHRIAVVGLPSKDYTQYKLADSETALKSASYAPIKNFVTYVLPEGDGKKIIYAQFKDSKGKESEIMTTYVNLKMSGPDLSYVSTATEYEIDQWGYFSVHVDFETGASGYMYCEIFDGDGNKLIWDMEMISTAGRGFKSFSFNAGVNTSKLTKAEKLVIYMTDEYDRNKSKKWEFDISVEMPYSVLETDDAYYVISNETGHIVFGTDIYLDDGTSSVTLPAYINGVKVTGIEDFVFNNCFIAAMNIPATYTYFESVDAFYGTGFTTFYVVEGSPAHEFMKQNAMNWDIAGLSKGDTDGDFVTTQEDVIVIADYILHPAALTEAQVAAADVYGDDGVVDIKDIIKLAQMASEQ